jgi:hypothetical protein
VIAVLVCIFAFAATAWAGSRSLANGVLALLTTGYLYGIVRANLPTTASHFIFDASLIGLYLSQRWIGRRGDSKKQTDIQHWAIVLILWPSVMCLVPLQNIWVTLVGLRGSILLLPLILLGCRLNNCDLRKISRGLVVLNILALGVAVAEYFAGIEPFFPRSEVTFIMYSSNDVAGGAFRIPSFFSSAHSYGGSMAITIPLLFGAWSQIDQKPMSRVFLLSGIGAALLGVLLSATRLQFIFAALLIVAASLSRRFKINDRIIWLGALLLISLFAVSNERTQRFTTLQDADFVARRLQGSVNQGFWEILMKYPFGNGLGGGGTSMPYFLQDQVTNPVQMENEYARILAEQGLVGLLLWVSFIVWYLQQRHAFLPSHWREGRRLAWIACAFCFATGLIAPGMLTAIPSTAIFLLYIGWISAPDAQHGPRSLGRPAERLLVGAISDRRVDAFSRP